MVLKACLGVSRNLQFRRVHGLFEHPAMRDIAEIFNYRWGLFLRKARKMFGVGWDFALGYAFVLVRC